MKNLSRIGRPRKDVEICIDKPVRCGLVTSEDVKMLVLSHGGLTTPRDIASRTGFTPNRIRSLISRWEQDRLIFILRFKGRIYIAEYALSISDGVVKPIPAMKFVINSLMTKMGSWQMAFWFMCGSNFLKGKTPERCLKRNPKLVIAAAKFELENMMHG
ncbi:MAG: hypothetical protein U1D41_05990 [Nitrosomonas sp.]|uniref:hypothetical protein n=1 Tax=Nitrosomonas sp. TaxID=42353 RepID=UPI002AB82E24|nr:hypothetical protein [Nitrosomonas sp.]MDZ4105703.1 hypothetical protein [Nitrosomonas sp.]